MKSRSLAAGKLPPGLLAELLEDPSSLPPEVRLGPALGEDASAIDVRAGTLVATSDPITLTGREVGAHAVVVNANDVAVTGVRPRWYLATVLLPIGTGEQEVRELFATTRAALAAVGASLVGGHTEVTPGVDQPIVCGVMLGFAPTGQIIRSGGMQTGDRLVQVGAAPIEGAAILASAISQNDDVGAEETRGARRALVDPGISVVEPALLAADLGAHALHDPTEGGIATGIHEMADASRARVTVDDTAVLWFAPGRAVCIALGANPWGTLASGTLLAAFAPANTGAAIDAFRERGWRAASIAQVQSGRGVFLADGSPLERFDRDEVARLGPRPSP